MPKYNRPARKRMNRRRRRGPTIKRQMGFIKAPVNTYAQRKFVKLNYSAYKDLISANNQTTVWSTWHANSLYDPDGAAGGHQPYSYNEWSVLYKAYRVYAVKVKVATSIQPDSTSASSICDMFIGCSASPVSTLTANVNYESPCYRNWQCTAEKPTTRTFYFTIAQIEGVGKNVIQTEQAYRGLMGNIGTGSDPPQLAYIYVGALSRLPGVAPTSEVNARTRITLTYYATLFEPNQLGES